MTFTLKWDPLNYYVECRQELTKMVNVDTVQQLLDKLDTIPAPECGRYVTGTGVLIDNLNNEHWPLLKILGDNVRCYVYPDGVLAIQQSGDSGYRVIKQERK